MRPNVGIVLIFNRRRKYIIPKFDIKKMKVFWLSILHRI